ncbi:hypothetical protein [Polaromonas naphthalenivorans]|uniref:Uncharacterized protein n=1 Tax=Polaromonas naphthalenivorans (strain CJ2) TaxID=365044 RepID=A1VWZ3_POLNA|nr:hypothetical protein [Polaromonas naphthalenivorans]ABM40171.1 hypothetical protein Pnap_4762 [Polaromonas naphthalenivorans CJ2]
MKLTREILMQYRRPKGMWTRAQLQALGVSWPPKHGWIKEVIGKELTEQQFDQFTGKNPAQGGLFD